MAANPYSMRDLFVARHTDFGRAMVQALRQYAHLTQPQIAALARTAGRTRDYREERANAEPIRAQADAVLSGRIVKAEWRVTRYGDAAKMLMKLDTGARVWGPCPAGLFAHIGHIDPDRRHGIGALAGQRVTLRVADLMPSGNDPLFGFYKRPRLLT
jgi:hypothetical protein